MASEILGLFNTPTTQQLRNAYLDKMMVSPAQMGSQGLLQQVVSMGQNAGAMLGMGAGQLLGGKVAGEVEASYINDAIQYAAQKGGTPSEKMSYVAEFLADKPGMGAQYMKALEEKRRIDLQELQTKKAQQELQPEFKDFHIPVQTMEPDGLGGLKQVTKSISVTHKWNPETKKYEPFGGAAATGAAATGATKPLTAAQEAKAQIEKNRAAVAGQQPQDAQQTLSLTDVVNQAQAGVKSAPMPTMKELSREASIERAGWNIGDEMERIQQLTPDQIRKNPPSVNREILRKYSPVLSEEQKEILTKNSVGGLIPARKI